MPLSVLVAVSKEPASTAPVWSVTVPRIRPKLACASSETENSSTLRAKASRYTLLPTWAVFIATDFISHPVSKGERKPLFGGGYQDLEALTLRLLGFDTPSQTPHDTPPPSVARR